MLQRPNFCCSCGEKIDRIEWHVWTSRRFCELCQTEHRFDEWMPKIAGGFFLLVGLFGIGSSIRSEETSNSLVYRPVGLAVERAERSVATGPAFERGSDLKRNDPIASREAVDTSGKSGRSEASGPPVERIAPAETVFFCGAETKKGTACTRRVKGGGRCWQHAGKESILPEEQLVVPAGK